MRAVLFSHWVPRERRLAVHGQRAHRMEELLGVRRERGVETGSLESVAQERVTA